MTRVVLKTVNLTACWSWPSLLPPLSTSISRAEQGNKLNGISVGLQPFIKYVTIVSGHNDDDDDMSRRTVDVFISTRVRFGWPPPNNHQARDFRSLSLFSSAFSITITIDGNEPFTALSPFRGYGVRVTDLENKMAKIQHCSRRVLEGIFISRKKNIVFWD